MTDIIFLIPLLPLAAFILIVLVTRKAPRLSAAVAILAIATSALVSISTLRQAWGNPQALQPPHGLEQRVSWMSVSLTQDPAKPGFELGTLLDPLSAVMLVVVTLVSLLVQVYSLGYMKDDPGFSRYFGFLSLFSFSMLGLVVSNNLLQTYIFWELVGVSSYLLIGFWYQKPEAASAAKKAFVVTRFGDFGFLTGLIVLSYVCGTFNLLSLRELVARGDLTAGFLTVVAMLIFCGAAGKSAQFPLHVWLPDAMEGPTPVSALIHAATMVAAGVYLVARCWFLFAAAPAAQEAVAWIGGLTALMAATIALVQHDIKRVLAWSTISQLGYMMLALGAGGYAAGMFHLSTHAWFKALLFLGAGSVIHALHTNDMREMGGLFRVMPFTALTFLAGALALAGVFPLAGFWSKDAVLDTVLQSGHTLLFWVALATAFLTAFYMARLFASVFVRPPKSREILLHARESPGVMLAPLAILAVLSVVGGLVGTPWNEHGLVWFLGWGQSPAAAGESGFNMPVAAGSTLVALAGLVFGWAVYARPGPLQGMLHQRFRLAYEVFAHKYWMDELWGFLMRRITFGVSAGAGWFDRHVVDGAVNGVAWLCRQAGQGLRYAQNGLVQTYALVFISGILVVYIFAMVVR